MSSLPLFAQTMDFKQPTSSRHCSHSNDVPARPSPSAALVSCEKSHARSADMTLPGGDRSATTARWSEFAGGSEGGQCSQGIQRTLRKRPMISPVPFLQASGKISKCTRGWSLLKSRPLAISLQAKSRVESSLQANLTRRHPEAHNGELPAVARSCSELVISSSRVRTYQETTRLLYSLYRYTVKLWIHIIEHCHYIYSCWLPLLYPQNNQLLMLPCKSIDVFHMLQHWLLVYCTINILICFIN